MSNISLIFNSLEGSGAWLLSNCEGFTADKAASGSENEQGVDGYTAKYRHLAHFGILFVSNNVA